METADHAARVPRFGTPGSGSSQPPLSTTMRLLRNSLLVALLVALGALLLPAASISGPIEDCADDGQLQGNYSDQQKQQALKDLPSDLSEYSDCGEILNAPNPSQGGSGGGGGGTNSGGGGSSGGATTTTQKSTAPAGPSKAELARQHRERAAIEAL